MLQVKYSSEDEQSTNFIGNEQNMRLNVWWKQRHVPKKSQRILLLDWGTSYSRQGSANGKSGVRCILPRRRHMHGLTLSRFDNHPLRWRFGQSGRPREAERRAARGWSKVRLFRGILPIFSLLESCGAGDHLLIILQGYTALEAIFGYGIFPSTEMMLEYVLGA